MFSEFAAVESYLRSLVNYESRLPLGSRDWPKLEPTLDAILRLGLPFSLPNCVHVAGTKGKGSTVSFLEALLSPDHKTLSFTSPHLISIKERVRLKGESLEDHLWCEGFSSIAVELNATPQIKLTYFESLFVFYLWVSQQINSTVHLVEAGLGGRWDATNVLENTLAVLTLVDYDHTEILGTTLTEIARDKAGIIKPHSRVVVGRQLEEALHVYAEEMTRMSAESNIFGVDFWWTDENASFSYHEPQMTMSHVAVKTSGRHQRDNAAIAIRVARLVDSQLIESQIRDRLANCVIPGRQQLFRGNPDVLVDVAHNPASFAALADTIRKDFANRRIVAVTGLMKDKDARACFSHLQGLISHFLVVAVDNPRSYPADELTGLLREMGFAASSYRVWKEAFAVLHKSSGHDLGLVTGSFYLAGDYLKWREHAGIA